MDVEHDPRTQGFGDQSRDDEEIGRGIDLYDGIAVAYSECRNPKRRKRCEADVLERDSKEIGAPAMLNRYSEDARALDDLLVRLTRAP